LLLHGISLHDEGKPWDGPTVHMQVPESFCPHFAEQPSVDVDWGSMSTASDDPEEVSG
jgi:hypothetical protein